MISHPDLGLMVSPDTDPTQAARWVVQFSAALEEEMAAARAARNADVDLDVDDSTDTEDADVDKLVKRWVNHKPQNSEQIRSVVKALRHLGYALKVSEPRSSGAGSRTYLRALRGDGANVGYMNSTSFSFVGASEMAKGERHVQDSARYPYIKWAAPGAIETVVNIAHRFLGEA